MAAAPLNIIRKDPVYGQLTTASQTRDTTAPSNVVVIASSDATYFSEVVGLTFLPIENITVRTPVWVWLSLDNGTTKRLIAELLLPTDTSDASVPKKATVWRRSFPLKAGSGGSTQILYASVYETKKVNFSAEQWIKG